MIHVLLAMFFLAASSPMAHGNPVNPTPTVAKTDEQALSTCYMGVDGTAYQCEREDEDEYLFCNVEANRRCKCAEGLACKRSLYTQEGATVQQCMFTCILEDPKTYGMKSPQEWNENMERFLNILLK